MAFLTRVAGAERLELTGDDHRIGRAPDNDLVLGDRSISRYHARVVTTDEGHLIIDEKSENGVLVNGERVRNRFLRDGDRILIGNIELRYNKGEVDLEATMLTPPPPALHKPAPAPAPAPPPEKPPIELPQPTPPIPPPSITDSADHRRATKSKFGPAIIGAVIVITILVAWYAIRFARGPQSKLAFKMKADRSVAKIAPQLAPLGPIARVRAKPQVTEVTATGGKVPIQDGAALHVPAGAFDKNTRIETSVIGLGLEHFDFSVRDSWAYVIRTVGEDNVQLKKTITLEIPYRPDAVRVAQLIGDTWQRIDVPPGRTTKVTIGHFSDKVFEVGTSTIAAEEGATAPTPMPSNPEPTVEEWIEMQRKQKEREARVKEMLRKRIETGTDATKHFYGVNEQAQHSTQENCAALTSVLDEFKRDPKNFAVPDSFAGASCSDLGINWLFPGQVPSKEPDNYYWREVAPSMDKIKQAVLASDKPLTEAQVLRIAIIANDGNVLKGILAAHNFLKDVTYKGRNYPNDKLGDMPQELGDIAAHLESWRHGTNVSLAGEYDKMGPIYHLFAAATARAWCGAAWGSIAVNGEAASRGFGTMGDKFDVEKGDADTCGRDLGATVSSLLPTNYKGLNIPAKDLWKYSDNPLSGEKAACPPSDVKSWQRHLCPWSPKDVSAEPCGPGFCWDGGFRGTLACKPEQDVPGGHRNDLNNIICADGSHLVMEECTGIPQRCEPNQ